MNDNSIAVAKIESGSKTLMYEASNEMLKFRINSLFSKEPDTIHWINQMKEGSVFIDIGANVGMYSIYAAVMRGCRVYAFEPESQNFAVLNRNIQINGVSELVTAFPIALSDEQKIDFLHLSQFNPGGSCHAFGEKTNFRLKELNSCFSQGSVSERLDDFYFEDDPAYDNGLHIKIDVDGFEHKVISGAENLIRLGVVNSVLVEINTALPEHMSIIDIMADYGFIFSQNQIDIAIRQEGTFKGVGNYIFYREDSGISFDDLKPAETASISGQAVAVPKPAGDYNIQEIVSHCVESINASSRSYDPYNTAKTANLFPPDFYDELLRCKPLDDDLISIADTPRTPGAYRERYVLELMKDESIMSLSREKRPIFFALREVLTSREFVTAAFANLGIDFDGCSFDPLYVRDKKGYSIAPHTDVSSRIFSIMISLAEDTDHRYLGTHVYKPVEKGFTSDGNKHFSEEADQFDMVETSPYLPNAAFFFERSGISFHGREKLTEEYDRNSICFIFRKKAEAA